MNVTPTRSCRACTSDDLQSALALGNLHLSDFLADPDKRPGKAPLRLVQCRACGLVQLDSTVARAALYHERYGYRSGVNSAIVANLHDVVKGALAFWAHKSRPRAAGSWLDIASNDGTLLSFVPREVIRIGVDPVSKFAPAARQHANLIIPDFFPTHSLSQAQDVDVITAVSMFYDVDDLPGFVAALAGTLAPDGLLVIQQNYLLDMVQQATFDNICHEHLTYFALGPLMHLLELHGLHVLKVELDSINGGCFRVYAARPDVFPLNVIDRRRILELLDEEAHVLLSRTVWVRMGQRVAEIIGRIRQEVDRWRSDNQRKVSILGASTRGSIIWQLAGLTADQVDCAIELQPDKFGRFYSPLGAVPIVHQDLFMNDEARHLILVGPYWHRDLLLRQWGPWLRRTGSTMLFPLPEVRAYGEGF